MSASQPPPPPTCASFTPHAFLVQKCLQCGASEAQHLLHRQQQQAAQAQPQDEPPPATPPRGMTRKGSLPPPPIPSLLQKQGSNSDLGGAGSDGNERHTPPAGPTPTRPPPPPRPTPSALASAVTPAPAPAPATVAPVTQPPPPVAGVRPPPPPPFVSSSGSFPSPVPTVPTSAPPPPPPHLRTESLSATESSYSHSPSLTASPSTSSILSPLASPLPPAVTMSTEPRGSGSRPPPPPPPTQLRTSDSGATDQVSSPVSVAAATVSSASATMAAAPVAATVAAPAAASAAATSPAATAAQWVDPNYLPSFALRLPHKFDVCVEQSNAGMHLLKRVRAFMKNFSSLQERYATELQKITSIERNKLVAMPKADQMTSCYRAWLGFFDGMDELSSANQDFSQELKEVTVEQLERWYGIGGVMVKDQKTEQERVHNAMLKVNLSVAQHRDAANQSLQKLASKRCEDSAAPGGHASGVNALGSPGAAGGKKAGIMDSIFKSSTNPSKAFEKSRETAIKTCESYTATLTQANASHHRYHAEELPAMMTQMQSLEEMRLHSLNAALRDFSRLQRTFTASMSRISGAIEDLSARMSANDDILGFVNSVVAEHGPALPPVPFTYDIPLSLAELKAMQFDEPPSSLFYSTIEGVMKHQRSMEGVLGSTASAIAHPTSAIGGAGSPRPASLELPLIVPTLLRGIYEHGGMQTEGIFRISVGSEELTRIRRQLEQGDFVLRESNPHVPACLLKSWLRDLLVPVFPWAVYERCIAVGQMEPWSAFNPVQANAVRAVMADLPPLHEKIVALLFGFLKRLASEPTYVAKTRMNLHNLALVFSPGLVRSENTDPMKMLSDTKFASNFVLRGVECSPACFSAEAQQCSAQLLDEIFSGNQLLADAP